MDNKKIRPFVRCVIQNFPFIEQDFDALTEYGLVSKVIEYLNKVINSQNLLVDQSNELANAFNQLKDYVDHYFDNLDVQEEINNKLDEMAEAGTLADIIAAYIQLQGVLVYDTVAAMKAATNLVDGSFAETYGFYAKGDGGGARYKVREVTNEDDVDEMFLIALANNQLVAELVPDERVSTIQVGIKGDGETDETEKISKLLNSGLRVHFAEGTFLVNETITITGNEIDVNGCGRSTIINSLLEGADLVQPVIDFSSPNVIYVDGLTTTNSAFKVYPSSGFNYIQAMREKSVFIRELHCETVNADISNKTNWNLFINTPAPETYPQQYSSGKYVNYPLEINNHSGYNAININNWVTNDEGTVQGAADNSAIGITDKVNGSSPVFLIDKYSARETMRVDYRDADAKYKQDNTVFEMNSYGAMALGCRIQPDTKLAGYATIKLHSADPSIMMYKEDDSENVQRLFMDLKHDTSAGTIYADFVFDNNVHYYLTDRGFCCPRLSNAWIGQWTAAQLYEGMMVYSTTSHKPLWFNGTAWIDGAGNTVVTPATPSE